MMGDKYLPGVEVLRDKAGCVKNALYSRLLISNNYMPKSSYSDFDVLRLIKSNVSDGGKVLFFPEFRRERVNSVRVNREKHERALMAREIVKTEDWDTFDVLLNLGFKREDDDSVFLGSDNLASLDKLCKRVRDSRHPVLFMVIINRKIYNVTIK